MSMCDRPSKTADRRSKTQQRACAREERYTVAMGCRRTAVVLGLVCGRAVRTGWKWRMRACVCVRFVCGCRLARAKMSRHEPTNNRKQTRPVDTRTTAHIHAYTSAHLQTRKTLLRTCQAQQGHNERQEHGHDVWRPRKSNLFPCPSNLLLTSYECSFSGCFTDQNLSRVLINLSI